MIYYLDTETNGVHTHAKPWVAVVNNDVYRLPANGAALRSLLKALTPKDTLVGYNIHFDLRVLAMSGYPVPYCRIHDVMIAYGSNKGLKQLHKEVFCSTAFERDELLEALRKRFPGRKVGELMTLTEHEPILGVKYCKRDVRMTRELYLALSTAQRNALDFCNATYWSVKRWVNGVLFDADELRALLRKPIPIILVPDGKGKMRKVNTNSHKQVAAYVGITGSTKKEILEDLGTDEAEKVLAVRSFNTQRAIAVSVLSYGEGKKYITVRPTERPMARTGRMTSVEPCLHQMPSASNGRLIFNLKKAIRPYHGETLVVADFSQIELRILACIIYPWMPQLVQAFRAGEDPHNTNANMIFHGDTGASFLSRLGAPTKEIDKYYNGANVVEAEAKILQSGIIRKRTKNTVFALIYGAGVPKIATMTKTPVGEARQISRKIRTTLCLDKATAFCAAVEQTLLLHRPVDPSPHRTLLNRTIQGTAADALHMSVDRVSSRKQVSTLLTIHDELWLSVKDRTILPLLAKDLTVNLSITKDSSLELVAKPEVKE